MGAPRSPATCPVWSCPTSIPGWAVCPRRWAGVTMLSYRKSSDDARLQKKQLRFGARSSSVGSPFQGDACCERPVGGTRAQPRVRCWQRRSSWGLICHPEPTPTQLPPPRLTTAAGDPQRSARQAPPDPGSPEVWGVSLGPGG